jgi:glycyl-tRNA synthetase
MGLTAAADTAAAAAHLAKADLATATVMEMTALAGTMGKHYALKQGLEPAVAEAIFEACLPRQAGDVLPVTPAGVVVAVADRLDSLVGLVAAVGAPSATADPFGLRRAAYGMLQVGALSC